MSFAGIGERIDLRELLDEIHAGLGIAVHKEAAPRDPKAIGGRVHHVIALRYLAPCSRAAEIDTCLLGPCPDR